jgi:hypothetical protein
MSACARCGRPTLTGSRFCDSCGYPAATPTTSPLQNEGAATFDLTPGLTARQAQDDRAPRYLMNSGWGLLILGVTLVVLSIWVPGRQDVTLFAGIVFSVFGPFMMLPAILGRRRARTSAASRLSVDNTGLWFTRTDGTVLSVRWTDPSLQIDICQLTGPDRGFLPAVDPRRAIPQWIYVYTPPNAFWQIWSTVPEDAVSVLVRAAQSHDVPTRVSRVGFFWFQGVKQAEGQLLWEYDGALRRAPNLNGRLFQIRGSMWQNSRTGYATSYWDAKRRMKEAGLISSQ